MVRQYIGARYVPKFFENPNNTAEWLPNTMYEPLTIVTYGLNSYTSKKTVPASVGNPSNNPEYWVATGNFNEFIEEVQKEISDINGSISDINDNVTAVTNTANTTRNLYAGNARKFVFVGDSYNTAAHHGGWGAGVITKLGLTEGVDVWNSGVGGASFSAGTLLSQLQTIAASMTADEKTSITDVVVQGAVNDWRATTANVATGVETCETFVHTTFPNAKYWIMLASWSYETTGIREGTISVAHRAVYEATKNAKICETFRLFVDPYFLEDDMVHPTQNGMSRLTDSIISLLNGGEAFIPEYSDLQAIFSGVRVDGNIDRYGVHVYKNDSVGFTFETPITVPGPSSSVTLGTATSNNLFENSTYFSGYAMYRLSDNTFISGRVNCNVVKNSDRSWDLKICSNEILSGYADYPVSNVSAVYLTFDCMLDYFRN